MNICNIEDLTCIDSWLTLKHDIEYCTCVTDVICMMHVYSNTHAGMQKYDICYFAFIHTKNQKNACTYTYIKTHL